MSITLNNIDLDSAIVSGTGVFYFLKDDHKRFIEMRFWYGSPSPVVYGGQAKAQHIQLDAKTLDTLSAHGRELLSRPEPSRIMR